MQSKIPSFFYFNGGVFVYILSNFWKKADACCVWTYDRLESFASNKHVRSGALVAAGVITTLAVQALANAWTANGQPDYDNMVPVSCHCLANVGEEFDLKLLTPWHQGVWELAFKAPGGFSQYVCHVWS